MTPTRSGFSAFCALDLALIIGLVGCSGPDTARVIGRLNGSQEHSATVDLPPSIVAGRAFTATITTYGSSNCTQPAWEQVTRTGALVRVVPIDEVATEGGCLRNLAPFAHHPRLQLDVVGPAVLRVVGYFVQDVEQVLDSVDVPIDVQP